MKAVITVTGRDKARGIITPKVSAENSNTAGTSSTSRRAF